MRIHYKAFTVKCVDCGHNNEPNHSPFFGVLSVLTGKWTTCRKCGITFGRIKVPLRPLVKKILQGIEKPAATIQLVEYSNSVPRALGFPS